MLPDLSGDGFPIAGSFDQFDAARFVMCELQECFADGAVER
jgi:hypothetical protein